MNKEDIIRMAREAGAEFAELPMMDAWLFTDDECLERFAAIVASVERERIKQANASEIERVNAHIKELEDASKKPEQEPVATLWQHGETGRTRITMPDDITDCDARWFKAANLYTTPPQRTWVGLTDEERKDIELGIEVFGTSVEDVLKEAEAKLKEKNCG